MRFPSLTLKVLSAIGDSVIDGADLLEAFIFYGAYSKNLKRQLKRLEVREHINKNKKESQNQFYTLIYKLKKEGLIEAKGNERSRLIHLTGKGKKYLSVLKNKCKEQLPKSYSLSMEPAWIIVVFDIPERERKKRDWLRAVLQNLKFKMLQRSVWLGKTKLPENFISDLYKLKLNHWVEIFEISKGGTLKHLI